MAKLVATRHDVYRYELDIHPIDTSGSGGEYGYAVSLHENDRCIFDYIYGIPMDEEPFEAGHGAIVALSRAFKNSRLLRDVRLPLNTRWPSSPFEEYDEPACIRSGIVNWIQCVLWVDRFRTKEALFVHLLLKNESSDNAGLDKSLTSFAAISFRSSVEEAELFGTQLESEAIAAATARRSEGVMDELDLWQ